MSNHNRKLWAAPEAFEWVYSDRNKTDVIVMFAPKGTAKSQTLNQIIIQGYEKEKWSADIMYIRDQENGHKLGSYADFLQLIDKYDLKGYNSEWSTSNHHFSKNGVETLLWGFDRGEGKITGFTKPLSMVSYDEVLKSSDKDKSDDYKARRANQQLKAVSSLRRNLVKGGKIILNANMHYKDPVWSEMIYTNFDPNEIRKIVKRDGYWFRILKGIKAFPNGISFLILDPNINQFLDKSVSEMPYVGEQEKQAMTESLPDESLFKEFPLAKVIKNVELIDLDDIHYRHDQVEFISMGMDPASGKDEISVQFFGIHTKKKQLILIDGMSMPTRGLKGKELLERVDSFWRDVQNKFLELYSEKLMPRSFAFYADTNQQLTTLQFVTKMAWYDWKKDPEERIIGIHPNIWLSNFNTAKKHGDWDRKGSISKVNEMFAYGKVGVYKTPHNLETMLEIKDLRIRIKQDAEGEIIWDIISHSDKWDSFKYGSQIAYDINYPNVMKLIWI